VASKIKLVDGREITVALNGKQVIDVLKSTEEGDYARFNTPAKSRVWVNKLAVAAIEDRPDLD
jgi:hypothetical protein